MALLLYGAVFTTKDGKTLLLSCFATAFAAQFSRRHEVSCDKVGALATAWSLLLHSTVLRRLQRLWLRLGHGVEVGMAVITAVDRKGVAVREDTTAQPICARLASPFDRDLTPIIDDVAAQGI